MPSFDRLRRQVIHSPGYVFLATRAGPPQSVAMTETVDDLALLSPAEVVSLQRAIAVKAYMERAGVAADNLGVQGFGPDRPVADNATAE